MTTVFDTPEPVCGQQCLASVAALLEDQLVASLLDDKFFHTYRPIDACQ